MDKILKKNIEKRIKEYYEDIKSQEELFIVVENYYGKILDKEEMKDMVNEIVRLTEIKQ